MESGLVDGAPYPEGLGIQEMAGKSMDMHLAGEQGTLRFKGGPGLKRKWPRTIGLEVLTLSFFLLGDFALMRS